jgi:hypothetical protein
MPEEVEQRMENGDQIVSTPYVTPYPPGFPVLVPGQVFSAQILEFMRSLDTPEIRLPARSRLPRLHRPGPGDRVDRPRPGRAQDAADLVEGRRPAGAAPKRS